MKSLLWKPFEMGGRTAQRDLFQDVRFAVETLRNGGSNSVRHDNTVRRVAVETLRNGGSNSGFLSTTNQPSKLWKPFEMGGRTAETSLWFIGLCCGNPSKWGVEQLAIAATVFGSGCGNPSKWGVEQHGFDAFLYAICCGNPSKWGVEQRTPR